MGKAVSNIKHICNVRETRIDWIAIRGGVKFVLADRRFICFIGKYRIWLIYLETSIEPNDSLGFKKCNRR